MLQQRPTITIICSTINRASLPIMLESWVNQELHEGDRFWLFGDGLGEIECLSRFPRVEYFPRPKSKYYGHRHLVEGMNKVETTHYSFMGDDDKYLPWAFRDVRPILTNIPVLTSIMVPSGDVIPFLKGATTNRPCMGGWQMWMPRHVKLMDFSMASDAEAWRNYKANDGEHVERFDVTPVMYKGAAMETGVI